MANFKKLVTFLAPFLCFTEIINADSFNFNNYNNHGIIGLINTPTARLYDQGSYGITLFNGDPDKKITFTASPYDWLETSVFYTSINDKPYCLEPLDPVCGQDYKDKGFNIKLKLKEEGRLPSIAIGINDIAGTGLYGSEYIVASYGINKIDMHFGIGWGNLNGSRYNFKNPFGYLDNRFFDRPEMLKGGGQFQASRYFSDKKASPFFGISYALNDRIIAKIEHDTTLTPGEIGFNDSSEQFSLGFDFRVNNNLTFGLSSERDDYISFRFIYKNNPLSIPNKKIYKENKLDKSLDPLVKFRKNLENNGIGVNKIIEDADSIGIELTQFTYGNLDLIEEIIYVAKNDAGVDKNVKKELRIADLVALSEIDDDFSKNSNLIYERKKERNFSTNNRLSFRPFLASREEFFKGAVLLENDSEYIIRDNLFFTSNLKYSIADNFDDLRYPPANSYPAQVRSDIKDYLLNFDNGIIIGRAQLDFHLTPKENHHLMITGGILEEMFSGIGFEYLYFENGKNYSVGFEIFDVKKRDYEMRFGHKDYENITGHINFNYRNYKLIPFDAKVSYGEYLAGDKGSTLELSRSFSNGMQFGFFASFTDVSKEEFGEGAFDKGIFFNIPIFGNFASYSWRPLTKDPGQKLIRKNTLHDLLVRFKPIN